MEKKKRKIYMKYFVIKLKDKFDIFEIQYDLGVFFRNNKYPDFITGKELAQILLDSNISISD